MGCTDSKPEPARNGAVETGAKGIQEVSEWIKCIVVMYGIPYSTSLYLCGSSIKS